MKSLHLITLFSLFYLTVQGQNNGELSYYNHSNAAASQEGGISATVFQVNQKVYKETVNSSSKVITNEYKAALEVVNLALRDSIEASRNESSSVFKEEALEDIRMYINNFLDSKEDYEEKKENLMDAQMVSVKHNLGYLLYADDETNIHYEHKFIKLANKKSDIKNYLKDMLDKVDNDIKTVSQVDNNKLKQARKKLKTVKKHEIVNDKANVKSYNLYTLGQVIPNPDANISGHFENLGVYYVLNNQVDGYASHQLVSAIEVRSKKINKENFLFKNSAVLIKNPITNATYLVRRGFVNHNKSQVVSMSDFD